MSIADELRARAASRTQVRCHTCRWLDSLEPEARREFVEEIFPDESHSNASIAWWANQKQKKIHVSETSVAKHRRGHGS